MAAEVDGSLSSHRGGRVGEYEIVSELARGGMGIVYHARQRSPRRDVALKMLLPREHDAEPLRERFRIEMQALAELDHPRILPLYQSGEQDGVLYFTMKLAGGGSLAERLGRERPSFRWAAQLVAALAEAVHYAHERGILHRDLKPGNVLFDEADNPYVADFGLAKLLDHEGGSATRSMETIGTPCYMAPEVALNGAKAATISSDVYGLGAILYELLTGRPPFMVEGLAALLLKVAGETPASPSTLVKSVPRDLEVVAMTSLAKEPRARYPSAGEVAADLRRWLEGTPVMARSPGAVERVWAWCRRRPALASMASALALSLSGGGLWLAITRHQLGHALHSTKAAREIANGRIEFLLGSFADTLESLGRLDVLDLAWADLDRTYSGDPESVSDPASRHRWARLLARWGRTLMMAGRFEEAEGKLRRAIDLAIVDPAAPGTLAEGRCSLALAIGESGYFEDALKLLDDTARNLQGEEFEPRVRWQSEAAAARAQLLTRWHALESSEQAGAADDEARAAGEKAVEGFRAWQLAKPAEPARVLRLCAALRDLGELNFHSPRRWPEDALPYFREAVLLARGLREKTTPADPRCDRELAQSLGWCGAMLRRMGAEHQPEALELLRQDNSIMTRLAAQDPGNWRWQVDLAHSHYALAQYFAQANQPAEEAKHRTSFHHASQQVVKNAPQVREWMLSYMNAAAGLAMLSLSRQPAEAVELFKDATSTADTLLLRRSHDVAEHEGWYKLHRGIGTALKMAGRPNEEQEVYQRALSLCEAQAKPGPNLALWRWSSARMRRRWADHFRDVKSMEAALRENDLSLRERVSLLTERWEPKKLALEVPNSYLNLAQILLELNRIGEALQSASECLDLWVRHADLAEIARARPAWAKVLITSIDAAANAGGQDQARARQLAARARAAFYGPARPQPIDESDKEMISRFEAVAVVAPPAAH